MFNARPINPVRDVTLQAEFLCGYHAVFSGIKTRIQATGKQVVTVTVDGTHGVPFARIQEGWLKFAEANGWNCATIDTSGYLRSGKEIREIFKENITDNRAFGYVAEAAIDAYFQTDARSRFRADAEAELATMSGRTTILLVAGTGAHWLCDGGGDVRLFCDISRETQQRLHRGGLLNFALDRNEDTTEKYKIAYFVEWPILETYRKRHLLSFDFYLDMNDPEKPVMATIDGLTAVIGDISRYPMRVKPFFAPGVWGGQYLKKLAGLPDHMVNCAWSFEPIAPENSILIECDGQIIEVPFLIVMSLQYLPIMGERIAGLFGDYFPVRFDYLDTIDGSNLSCQVHPKQRYIRETFNERLEQQESYYIMETKGNSKVYLGLTETCTEDEFIGAVEHAQETGTPMDFTRYVQEWDSRKGDLFLIPTGTVHCSGKDNLVLEISATTWWFTFKIYDYVRKDLDGKPRPINIEHAKENIDYYKKTEWVRENLIPSPTLLKEVGGNREYLLGKRDDLLFFVNRIHLEDLYEDDTDGEFLLLNLVEGEQIRIESLDFPEVSVQFGYAESYLLPAVFGRFRIVNLGESPCKIIKAGVSPDWKERICYE